MEQVLLWLLVVLHIEVLALLVLLIIHIRSHHTQHKPDPLLKQIKEFIAEGYTLQQIQQKLKKLGFSEQRIERITHSFLRH